VEGNREENWDMVLLLDEFAPLNDMEEVQLATEIPSLSAAIATSSFRLLQNL
jgi:hypothetical protein